MIPNRMMAVVTTGAGGYEKLSYQEVATPKPGAGEVLVKVAAAGINNTDINTRIGWYSSNVIGATNDSTPDPAADDGGWNGATPFPLIQGCDACGHVAAVGEGADAALIGARVLIRSCMRVSGFGSNDCIWMGPDFDGAFAQFVKVPAAEVFPVTCDWSDAELATIPCAYGTAENMIHRAGLKSGARVLIPGASGGVASAAIQLAKRRGAEVIAITSASKRDAIKALGADVALTRETDLVAELGSNCIDLVLDNVVGDGFAAMLDLLKPGGTYVTSGAIAGPIVPLDTRMLYLKDLTMMGSTAWDEPVFPNLINYIERAEIKPLLAGTYPLEEIETAQRAFMEKSHIGKLALNPPA